MRIVVDGAGALGGLIGAQLAAAGEDVTLVDVNPARVKLLNAEGLYIAEEEKGEQHFRVRTTTSVSGPEPADLVLLAVKSYQTDEALAGVRSVIGPATLVLSLQNGIGNTETIARALGPDRIVSGITYHSIQHVGPNRLRYRAGIKPIQIAPHSGEITPEIEAVGALFNRAGLATEVVDNIDHSIWQKLLHNAVVNPVSALTGLTCKEMLEDENVQAFMRKLADEILAVMRARGVPIVNEEDPFAPIVGSQKALGKNRPSMWQDLTRGYPTEVDAINGAVADEAERLGLEAPHNWALCRFIHSREHWKILRRQKDRHTVEAAAVASAERPRVRAATTTPADDLPSGRVPLKTAGRLKALIQGYFLDLQAAAEDPDRQIAWVSGLGPVEMVRAFGLTPYCPENHAALIGTGRGAERYISRAMAEGFSQFVSSAMACDIGAMLAGESPLVTAHGMSGPPRPAVVLYNTSNGHDLIHWFEYYGRHYRVPVIGLHPPAFLDTVDRIDVDAVVEQHMRMIRRLESLTLRKVNVNRLSEVVRLSGRAAALWAEILDLAKSVPSPLTFFDMLIHMAPMILMRGTPECVEYYTVLKAELEERVAENRAAVPGERFRVYWEGPPIWGALRSLAKLFLDRQVAVVGSTYCAICALDGLDPMNPVESLARVYTGIFTNRSDDAKADILTRQFERFGVDGVIYHEGRTCPEHSNVRYGLERRLSEATAIPSIVIEADSHDLRLFSKDAVRLRLRDFLELMEESPSTPAATGGS